MNLPGLSECDGGAMPVNRIWTLDLSNWKRDRSGSVALMTALISPGLIMMAGIAIEVSSWASVKIDLQRQADIAALAGLLDLDAGLGAQVGANTAASVAELNGATGTATRTWNSNTSTLTDSEVTVVIGPGIRNSSNTGIMVTVTKLIPTILTRVMTSQPTVMLTASAWAEYSKAQPCLLALGTNGPGISGQGNPTLTLSGCTVRSNSSIGTGGSASISAPSIWARTTISGSGITGTLHPNSGTVPDPYKTNSAIVAAFNALKPGQGTAISNNPNQTTALSPGTYSSWDIKGRLTLAAGTYYVNGNISIGSQGIITGTGITIVTSGVLSQSGGSQLNISAALNTTSGAIPAVVFAGNSSSGSGFGGTTQANVTGVVYYPNGAVAFNGTSSGGSAGCLEIIANSIQMQGNSSMASNCGYSALSFGDATSLGLVQ